MAEGRGSTRGLACTHWWSWMAGRRVWPPGHEHRSRRRTWHMWRGASVTKATGEGMQEVWREWEKAMPCLVGTERGTTRRWNGGGHGAARMRAAVSLARWPWQTRPCSAHASGKGEGGWERAARWPTRSEKGGGRTGCGRGAAVAQALLLGHSKRKAERGRRRMERAEGAGLFTQREDAWAWGVEQRGHRRATRRSASVRVGHCCCFSNFKILIPPQTYSWNVNFPPFVTPKPFSFDTSYSNQSCRATQDLQLCFKCQSLIRPILKDMELRKRAPQTEIWTSVLYRLKRHASPYSDSQNKQWKAKPITPCGRAIRVLQHFLQVLGKIPTGLQI
jgi:hypothetical protein